MAPGFFVLSSRIFKTTFSKNYVFHIIPIGQGIAAADPSSDFADCVARL